MDWANATKIHTPPICQTLSSPPDKHALYKGNFATGNGEPLLFGSEQVEQQRYVQRLTTHVHSYCFAH